jgi:hypothetical protein
MVSHENCVERVKGQFVAVFHQETLAIVVFGHIGIRPGDRQVAAGGPFATA